MHYITGNVVHYYFSDYLGTHSLITDANGDMPPQEESDYYPYGGEIPVSGSDPNHYKFTGKERDVESGLDNFGARYQASSLGRFMSPDTATPNPHDPQTINRYAYARNNPLAYVDNDGRLAEWIHQEITVDVLTNMGVSEAVAKAIAKENAHTDQCCNDEAHAYMHSQAGRTKSGEWQTPEEAARTQGAFVRDSVFSAAYDLFTGNFDTAREKLGQALHAVQDEKHDFQPFAAHTGGLSDLASPEGMVQDVSDVWPTDDEKAAAKKRTSEVLDEFEQQVEVVGVMQGLSELDIGLTLHEFYNNLTPSKDIKCG